ncbi:MAG: asparagine synthase (glutamine-hydrolyzing) [Bacteroidales bacterium]|nr:asparagine synthase (glutamine-hydrolyzing) [Bacteroidales bacterium]
MCGIAGIINFTNKPVEQEKVQFMMNTLKHRGPDDEGIFIKDNFGLGHVRLSILDLSSAGHQPMFSNDGRYGIVFNGEIYNYIELKEELKSKYSFKTRTDTEVILAAYQQWGEACLDRFNGDFAFVIYDNKEKEFLGVRDRYGIKPFYYYKDQEQFIFASELKAIVPLLKKKAPNEKLIFEYLIYNRTDQSLETFFDGIVKLDHGHYFKIKNNKFSTHQWYKLADKIHPLDLSPEEYREELRSTSKLRLRSDVPVGISLSGGIDSSAVTSILYHDFGLHEIKSFSAVYGKDKWADESNFIDEYNSQLKNMFFTNIDADTFFNDFQKFLIAQNEPVAAIGPYAQYKVMELAHGNVVVTLDGQGADEQLGGYHYFFGGYFKELLRTKQLLRFLSEASYYLKKHKSFYAFKYLAFYLLPVKYKKNIGSKLFGSVNKDFYNRLNSRSTIDEDLYNPNTLNESLLQHFEHKLEHLLKWDDHNSLAFSIESRVPFLDHNLVEKTLSTPPERKIYKAETKHILRESVKDILPHKIYKRRDKKGFTTPADEWFNNEKFVAYIDDLLNSESFRTRGYFNAEDCKRKFELHKNLKADVTKDIWKWINLEFWFRTYIDNSNIKINDTMH